MFCDRVVLPSSLRSKALSILHSAHKGTSAMEVRAKSLLFWPGINKDIKMRRDECDVCCKNTPSQPALPAQSNPDIHTTPFESIFADFFDASGCQNLIAGDRLSGWVEVFSSKHGSSKSGSVWLVSHLRSLFATFSVPETISCDGSPEFTASHTSDFLKRWGVKHRMSSAYFPKSNGRAEVAVKKVKRFLLSCIGPSGTLDTDNFLQGMLQLCNTPDRDCNVSPAQILFGRPLWDAFSFVNRYIKFDNPAIDKTWKEVWKSKELALRTRFVRSAESMNQHAHPLPVLQCGDRVFVQNQTGPHPNKWDRSGVVVECHQARWYWQTFSEEPKVSQKVYASTFQPWV